MSGTSTVATAGAWVVAVVGVAGWVAAVVALGGVLAGRRAARRRAEALARACHELRGPLHAARLGLSLAGGQRALPAARAQAVDGELRRAASVLDDLMAIRRPPRRGVGLAARAAGRRRRVRPAGLAPRSWERIDVDRLLAEVVAGAQGRAMVAGVPLTVEPGGPGGESPPAVWGDPTRLAQAVANLIANALRHGAGPVRVSASPRAGTVRIEVRDAGPGLPAPVAEVVAARGRRDGDHGHGLAVALSVARSHAGSLSAAPSRHGARLVLTLPAAAAPHERRA